MTLKYDDDGTSSPDFIEHLSEFFCETIASIFIIVSYLFSGSEFFDLSANRCMRSGDFIWKEESSRFDDTILAIDDEDPFFSDLDTVLYGS